MTWTFDRRAEESLIGNWLDGNDRFSPQKADAYQAGLAATFDLLSGHLELAQERAELVPLLQVHPSGSHLVLAQLRADGTISVVRIKHQASAQGLGVVSALRRGGDVGPDEGHPISLLGVE